MKVCRIGRDSTPHLLPRGEGVRTHGGGDCGGSACGWRLRNVDFRGCRRHTVQYSLLLCRAGPRVCCRHGGARRVAL